jgi:hypothetical protein
MVIRTARIATAIGKAVRASLAGPVLASCVATGCSGDGARNGGSGPDSGPFFSPWSDASCPTTTYTPVFGGTGSGACLLAPYPCGTPLGNCSVLGGTYDLAQSAASCDPLDSGALDAAVCETLCPNWYGGSNACAVFDDDAGGHVKCSYRCVGGRRPEGLVEARSATHTHHGPVAEVLARMAYLEAASVPAFERLARELDAHCAPRRLRTASRRAARDEQRHARVMRRLAEREGARVAPSTVEPRPVRSLDALAIENAVEGCVRETFGAAVAAIQAQRAGDPAVRRAMKGIARDEAFHAELSWAVARWLEPRLTKAQRQKVRLARCRAIAQLVSSASSETDEAARSRLGVPDAAQAVALLRELDATLWSPEA